MKTILIIIGVIIIASIAWYGLSPLWNNVEVQDELPISTPAPDATSDTTATLSDPVPVVATAVHPASGQVRIVREGDKTYVRYENYKTINGPDLKIYLANDLDAKDYVNLGELKGTEGNINYEIPAGVDVDQYKYVLTWCEQFSVLFNSADLSSIHLNQ